MAPGPPRRRRRAFTLLEVMVAILVIAVIVALAFPSLLRSRISSNEASAIASLRALVSVEEIYKTSEGVYAVFDTLDFAAPPLIEGFSDVIDEFSGLPMPGVRQKSGYQFFILGEGGTGFCPELGTSQYAVMCHPTTQGKSGNRFFAVDASGVIRWAPTFINYGVDLGGTPHCTLFYVDPAGDVYIPPSLDGDDAGTKIGNLPRTGPS